MDEQAKEAQQQQQHELLQRQQHQQQQRSSQSKKKRGSKDVLIQQPVPPTGASRQPGRGAPGDAGLAETTRACELVI